MPKAAVVMAIDNTTDAGYRVWGKAISDMLKSVLTQVTTEEGQIDWAGLTGFKDTFTRANGSQGGVNGWVQTGGTGSIVSNQLSVVGNNAIMNRDCGTGDVKFTATLGATIDRPMLAVKGVANMSTCFRFNPVAGAVQRMSSVGIVTATPATFTAFTPAPGDVLEYEVTGTTHTCRRNGVQVVQFVDAALNSQQNVGFYNETSGTPTNVFDDAQLSIVRSAGSTFPHYEMYRFSDALQATRPLFVKVEYGAANTQTWANMRVSVGSGTNGFGGLTGPVGVSFAGGPTTSSHVTTTTNSYACYKDGYFGFAWALAPAANINTPHLAFFVDRTRDTNGVATNDGLLWWGWNANTANGTWGGWSYDLGAGVTGGTSTVVPVMTPQFTGQSSVQAKAKLYPIRAFMPDEFAITGALTYLGTEFTPFTEFDIAPLPGMSTQRYLTLGTYTIGAGTSNAYWSAFRYES